MVRMSKDETINFSASEVSGGRSGLGLVGRIAAITLGSLPFMRAGSTTISEMTSTITAAALVTQAFQVVTEKIFLKVVEASINIRPTVLKADSTSRTRGPASALMSGLN